MKTVFNFSLVMIVIVSIITGLCLVNMPVAKAGINDILLINHAITSSAFGDFSHNYGKSMPIPLIGMTNPYCRWIRKSDGAIWDGNKLTTAPTWSSQVVTLTKGTNTKLYNFAPPSGIDNGAYAVPFYDNASPANTDEPVRMKYVTIYEGEITDIYEI